MKWEKFWTRDYSIHYVELCLRLARTKLELSGLNSFKKMVFIKKSGNFTLYSTKEEKEMFQKENHNNFLKDPYTFIQNTLNISKKFCEFTKKFSKKDLTKLSNKRILENLKEYYRLWIDFSIYVWRIWNLSETYADYVSKYISEKAIK